MLVTAFVLGALVWWTQRRGVPPPTETQPDAVIWAMVRACREGDSRRYLDCFAGKLRERLEKVAQEQGDHAFSTSLWQMIAPVKGITVFEPKKDGQGDWRIVAEFVFADRTERQTFHVRQVGGVWKIVSIEAARPVPVLIPYGTPVKGL
ncbi:MAG: hypothetical protein HZLCBSQH_001923 [Candidatus Fervidibacterota bacterium]